eukprot:692186-Alexandrium_andersonii.AAC.1
MAHEQPRSARHRGSSVGPLADFGRFFRQNSRAHEGTPPMSRCGFWVLGVIPFSKLFRSSQTANRTVVHAR